MTLDDSIQVFRLRVLREAQRSSNVSATCGWRIRRNPTSFDFRVP